MTRRLALFLTPTICFFLVWLFSRHTDPLPGFPRVMLWAPERPEDLRFIRTDSTGIAFVARTVQLIPGGVTSHPRQQPLQFPQGTRLMAVIRLAASGSGLPDRADVVRELLTVRGLPRVSGLQIDFDPNASEHDWYAALLRETRQALPSGFPLTIVAPPSWCHTDSVDDVTPRASPPFSCGSSIGVSIDEFPAQLQRRQRLYISNPRPWTQESYEAAMLWASKW